MLQPRPGRWRARRCQGWDTGETPGPPAELHGIPGCSTWTCLPTRSLPHDAQLATRIGNLRFFSATYRLFKLAALESACEDYGQAVIYKGSIPAHAGRFKLDKHHDVQTGKVFPVCGNTWHMLHGTRFAKHFDFIGNFDTHHGIFEGCGSDLPFESQAVAGTPAPCC